MNRIERKVAIELYEREAKRLQRIEVKCQSCEYQARAGICSKFDAVPPPEVQQTGCDDWQHDDIPF